MKKIKMYRVILIILIISVIPVIFLISRKYIARMKNENYLKETLALIKEESEETNIESGIDILNEIDEEIQGYKVIGIIKIPKINLEYPILDATTENSLKLSITKFYGGEVNQVGNITLAGHNYTGGVLFGKIKNLNEGDIIELTDKQNVTIRYQIFKKYVTDPNDVKCVQSENQDAREVTLVTCTNGRKNRLIIKAREII